MSELDGLLQEKWYLAGPMRGYRKYNVPAFKAAATHLRKLGYSIISPAELDSPAIQAVSAVSTDGMECDRTGKLGGETAGQILGRDIRIVIDDVTGIMLLPGWHKSRGARLEAFAGLELQHEFALYEGGVVWPREAHEIWDGLAGALESRWDL